MQHRNERRMRLLETHSTTVERRTLAGLQRLVESGKVSVRDLTDTELTRIVAGVPGDAGFDVRHLSDDELNAIIDG